MKSNKNWNLTRRNALKNLGAAAVLLPFGMKSVSAKESPAKLLRPDISDFPALNEVSVSIFDSEKIYTKLAGAATVESNEPSGYSVIVEGLRNERGEFTPERASARVRVAKKEESPRFRRTETSQSGSDTISEQSDEIGTMGHSGGGGNSNYEGGVWCRSRDGANLTLCRTDMWVKWQASGGEVTSASRTYDATAYQYGSPINSAWYIDNAGLSDFSFAGNDVYSKGYGNYYNWTWNNDNLETTAHHRLYLWGHPDGSMNWEAGHWHNGENANLILVSAGKYDYY